jgi:zinc transporter
LQAVEAVRQEIANGAALRAPANLVESILEEIAGDCERRVQTLSDDLDRVEDRALADTVHDDRRPLGHLRRSIVRLHRRIGSLLTMIHRLDHQALTEPAASLHAAVARVTQRLVDLEHALREMQERGRLLQEEVANKLATETNNYLQAISVLTALFLPPTLIVGIFGMNTKGLPLADADDGFLWVMLLSIACSAGAYWLLKRAPRLFKGSGLIR